MPPELNNLKCHNSTQEITYPCGYVWALPFREKRYVFLLAPVEYFTVKLVAAEFKEITISADFLNFIHKRYHDT